jgi:NADH-quinone oxidoreductase subunit D
MEWMDTAFGPLFPGLPGGLAPTLTLDGDTVVSASLASGIMHRGVISSLPGPAATFPDRLAALDPQAPVSYRTLAVKALADAAPSPLAQDDAGWIAGCERERAASHLGWLAGFGELLGMEWLAARASELHLALVRAPDIASVTSVHARVERLLRDIGRTVPLKIRLAGVGLLDKTVVADASGPVARGSGIATDTRTGNAAYADYDFRPVLKDGGDAFARLQVRTAEIRQSLRIMSAAGNVTAPAIHVPPHLTGTGMATIETPRGAASLHIEVHHGQIQVAHVTAPSSQHARLVPHVVEQAELADALVGIASLDLSPWEMDQ